MNTPSIIILAAGKGTRMKSDLPKVMHPLAGFPLVWHVRKTAEVLGASHLIGVIGPDMPDVSEALSPWPTVEQTERLGTGHAVQVGLAALPAPVTGAVVVLYGDTPLLQPDTVQQMLDALATDPRAALVVLGFHTDEPLPYGRLKMAGKQLDAIIEYADATPDERQITLCNSGVMVMRGETLLQLLAQLDNRNSKGEYYLTDLVHHARAAGHSCLVVETAEDEVLGVNSRADLAGLEQRLQTQLRQRHLAAGVTLLDPDSVYFAADTALGRDVVIEPAVFFGPGVTLADGVTVKAFSHLEGATLAKGVTVGPFARLRPGTVLEAGVRIGNFVETKAVTFAAGSKANHLSYIGDAKVGFGTNIGAGTITCNYDGFQKAKTVLGNGVFVGSNTALVAPVTVADGAIIGAGSTITADVPADALSLTRADQKTVPGAARRFRGRRGKGKVAEMPGTHYTQGHGSSTLP